MGTAPGSGLWLSLGAGLVMAGASAMLVAAFRAEPAVVPSSGLLLSPPAPSPSAVTGVPPQSPHVGAAQSASVGVDRAADPGGAAASGEQSAARVAGLQLAPMASYPLVAPLAEPAGEDPLQTTVIPPPGATLVVQEPGGGERRQMLSGHTTIGRSASNDVVINDDYASSDHAAIQRCNRGWELVDVGSTNGTERNGVAVVEPVVLEPGDVIAVGNSLLVFA